MYPIFKSVVDSIRPAHGFASFGLGVAVTHTVEMPHVDRLANFSQRTFDLARPYARSAALIAGGMLAAAITSTPRMAALGTGGLLSAAAASNPADGPSYAMAGLLAGVAILCAHHILPYVGFGLGAWAADTAMVRLAKHDALRIDLAPTCAGLMRAAPAQLGAILGLPTVAAAPRTGVARPATSVRLSAGSKTAPAAAVSPRGAAASASQPSTVDSFSRRLAGLFAAVYAWAMNLARAVLLGSRRLEMAPLPAAQEASPQPAAAATTIAPSVPILPPRRAGASAKTTA